MVTLDTINCFEVSRKIMADCPIDDKKDPYPSGNGNLPLSDYFEDIKQLFDGKDAIELNEIKTRLQSIYTNVIDIVTIEN